MISVNTKAPFRVEVPWAALPPETEEIRARYNIPPMGGYLRSLSVVIDTWHPAAPRHRRPRHAADRTVSRRSRAGSRRTKKYGLRPKGPAREGWDAWAEIPWDQGPFNPIEVMELR